MKPLSSTRSLSTPLAVGLACACAAAGLFAIYGSVVQLLNIWRTDDLKSMGLAVPFVCFALILRAWRGIGWRAEGSWSQGSWQGFALLAVSAVLMFIRDRTLLIVTVNRNWLIQLPPLPLVALIYALSLVLLFGGRRLLRAALFPVLFMVAVIPVPQTFSRRVDLPLQHASASVARGFAHLLGQPLTQDSLKLMFTPNFGMFIAPGCNGIRGAVTLGLAAVVVGYLYRFRWYIYAPVVAGAVLLGYLFNFLRLCMLVVYYKLVLPYPWFQQHATMADYLIGGALFLCALSIFFTVANKLRRDIPEGADGPPSFPPAAPGPRALPYLSKVAALLALAALFGFDAYRTHIAEATSLGQPAAPVLMPQRIGDFTLVRTWNDTLVGGTIVYTWGDYATADTSAPHVAFGISPVLGIHDAEVCHLARGDDPTWHGQIVTPIPGGSVEMSAATYNSGVTQSLEASTVCDGSLCHQYSQSSRHITLIYAHPSNALPLQGITTRQVPVLLKVESQDITTPAAQLEPQLAARLAEFLRQADLVALTAPYAIR